MKTFKRSGSWRTCRSVRWGWWLALLGAAPVLQSLAQDGKGDVPPVFTAPPVAQTPAVQALPASSPPAFADYTGTPDVLKMVEAGVGPEVVKAYIKNSAQPYRLTATDIITLKERGVTSDVITAMLQRDMEARGTVTPAPPAIPAPQLAVAPPANAAPAPVLQYAPPPVYAAPAYPYVAPAYPVYDSAYYYGSPWPYCYPGFSIGFGYGFGGHYGSHGSYGGHGGGGVAHGGHH